MKPLLGVFSQASHKLSRNPLGIIALFIVLVYGIAALVLGVSSNDLQPNERFPLICFLVIFPVIVLAVFYRLVSNHHVKLYAPNDFPDKDGFFRVLSPLEQKKKLEEEIKLVEADIETEKASLSPTPEVKSIDAETNGKELIKNISTRHAYVLAEELAFREIENLNGVSINRQVSVGRDFRVDGIYFLSDGTTVAVEIKYVRKIKYIDKIFKNEVNRFSQIAESFAISGRPKPAFSLVIVTENVSDESNSLTIEKFTKITEDYKLRSEILVFSLKELKEKYGITENNTQQGHSH